MDYGYVSPYSIGNGVKGKQHAQRETQGGQVLDDYGADDEVFRPGRFIGPQTPVSTASEVVAFDGRAVLPSFRTCRGER